MGESAEIRLYQRASDGKSSLLKRSRVAIGSPASAVAGSALYAFVATSDGGAEMAIVDFTDPDAPMVSGTYNTPSRTSGTALFAADSLVYLGTRRDPSAAEIFILDVSDPTSPELVNAFEIGADVSEIHVEGTVAYVGSSEGLHLFDLADASESRELAFLSLNQVTGLDVNHGLAFVTTAGSGDNFFVVDVENPAAPRLLYATKVGEEATDVEAYFDTAYVSARNGVYAVDTSEAPAILGVHASDAAFAALDLSHGTVYATSAEPRKLVVLDPGIFASQPIADVNGDGEILISHLGDSNTQLGWSGLETWSEVLQGSYDSAGLGWRVDAEQAMGGGTVADFGIVLGGIEHAARYQLEATLQKQTPDAFVLAFVTNDIDFWSGGMLPEKSIADLAASYRDHEATIAAVDENISIFITTSPPRGMGARYGQPFRFNLSVMNEALFEGYRSSQIIDSFTALDQTEDLVADGIHLSQSGHDLRAALVFEKLVGRDK